MHNESLLKHCSIIIAKVLIIGIGATIIMDLWGIALALISHSSYEWSTAGRMIGYLLRGEWLWHDGIMRAALPHENILGWITHYTIGILYALFYVIFCNDGFHQKADFLKSLSFAWFLMIFPLGMLAPITGNGFFNLETHTPLINLIHTFFSHSCFGIGLWACYTAVNKTLWNHEHMEFINHPIHTWHQIMQKIKKDQK